MADGYIIVIAGPDNFTVPAQAVERDREAAETARDRANSRAGLSGREAAYEVAAITVEQPLPTVKQILAWLQQSGWKHCSTGVGGTMWMSPDGRQVAIPGADSDEWATLGALRRIADASGTTQARLMAVMRDG